VRDHGADPGSWEGFGASWGRVWRQTLEEADAALDPERSRSTFARRTSALDANLDARPARNVAKSGTVRTRERDRSTRARAGATLVRSRVVVVPHEVASEDEIEPGTVLLDRFRVDHLFAVGGMSVLYRGVDQTTSLPVAVKVLPSRLRTKRLAARFEREARMAIGVRHPNWVVTHAAGTLESGTPYLVMELLEGETVYDRLRYDGPFPLPEAVQILCAVLDGVHAAHQHHIIHRDLKPSNVFLTRDGAVKLIDFGLSKDLGSQQDRTMVTGPGEALGTPSYMSPEQVLAEDVDPRTDMWGAGVLFYEMITGFRAFPRAEGGVQDTFTMVLEHEPRLATERNPSLPFGVNVVLARALRKEKEDRFATIAELRDALTGLV
jgi:serine/threonine protein kinase